ncbi:hypothetical protein [Pseudoalteromonas galatheae]|uniref:hypothetical protein n=1 Tax=Pseudoalteromonas galatheae TaxID=579562 RepID=UPI0030CC8EC6
MDKITNEEFKQQIERWQAQIALADIRLPNGEALPDKFFHLFLGVGYSTFKKMISGKESIREIQPYTARTIRFLNKLDDQVFLSEIRLCIPHYINKYQD